MSNKLSRRSFLAGSAALGALLGSRMRIVLAEDGPEEHRFISCYFSGGWDITLAGDPRDPTGTYAGIQLGTELLAPEWREPLAASIGGTATMLGSTMGAILPHTDFMTLFRGVNMNTVAHPSGRAYVNTFMPPSGATPKGSSLATAFSSMGQLPSERVIPNVSIQVPSFNTAYPPQFTAVSLGRASEILDIVRPDAPVQEHLVAKLHALQDKMESCVGTRYGTPRLGDELLGSRERVRSLIEGDVGQFFDFASDSADMAAVRDRYQFAPGDANRSDPRVTAATAAQLLKTGLTRAVSVELQNGLDHHTNWAAAHPVRLAAGFNALGALIADLREDDPGLTRTTIVAHSEFSRTPLINGSGGRDHFFPNTIMVFGSRLRPGVFGATREDNLGLMPVDLATGQASEGGTIVLPEQIGATLISAVGGDYSPYRTQPINSLIVEGN